MRQSPLLGAAFCCFLGVILFGFAAPAHGQGELADGNARFEYNDGFNGSADLQPEGIGGSDHLFAIWWWFRIDGAPNETILPFPPAGSYAGSAHIVTYSQPQFDATLLTILEDNVVADTCTLTHELTVTNTTSDPLTINFFSYLDADVSGDAGNDSAAVVGGNPTIIQINDEVSGFVQFRGVDSETYHVEQFSELLGLLNDGEVTDFDNLGLPFGPADFTGSYQWVLDLQPGESQSLFVGVGVNTTAPASGGPPPAPADFIRGDVDGDGVLIGLADSLYVLFFQFVSGSPPPPCMEAADVDGNGTFSGLLEGLYLLTQVFAMGPPPPPPYPRCGPDPDPATSLGCVLSGC